MKKELKRVLGFGFASLLIAGIMACGDKKSVQVDSNEDEFAEQNEGHEDVLISLGNLQVTDHVQDNGHTYVYTIDRAPLDSVIVTDEDGYRSRDNSILLTIQRDGVTYFQKTFTRSAFHIRIDENYYQQCILLGMNFDRVTEYGLRFIASIGKGADSEDYKPYSLTVGMDGSTNITEHDLYEDDEVARFEDEGV